MVGTRVLLTIAACSMVALAGCTDAPRDEDLEPQNVITTPKDYSYLDNATDGGGWHVHDYWRGQDNLTVLDATRDCQGCSSINTGGGDVSIARFRPDPDNVIPQGAARVHITATWSLDETNSQYDAVHLWVRTAADKEEQDLGPIGSGQTIIFESDNDRNDPPHHVLSLWEFSLRATPSEGEARAQGWNVHMTARAERGLEIPEWPPHPDHWDGATELALLEMTRDGNRVEYQTPVGGYSIYCFGGCLGSFGLEDGAVVPFDAQWMEVVIEHAPASTPMLRLSYHGADTWNLVEVEPTESDTHRFTYRIDLSGRTTDSPYALQSLWEFWLDIDQDTPARTYQGEYTVTVTVGKE